MRQAVEHTRIEEMPASFDQVHGKQSKTPWATLILVLILIIFGAYWLFAQRSEPEASFVSAPQASTPVDLSSLETALAQTVVPDFSTLF